MVSPCFSSLRCLHGDFVEPPVAVASPYQTLRLRDALERMRVLENQERRWYQQGDSEDASLGGDIAASRQLAYICREKLRGVDKGR